MKPFSGKIRYEFSETWFQVDNGVIKEVRIELMNNLLSPRALVVSTYNSFIIDHLRVGVED